MADGGEQETLMRPKINSGQTAALAPDMLVVCSSCSLANRANSKFCKKCGATLSVPTDSAENPSPNPPFSFPKFEIQPLQSGNPSSPAFGETVALQTPTFTPPNTSSNLPTIKNGNFATNKFLIIGVLLGIALVGGIVWFMNQPHPTEAKLDKSITNNQLFTPVGENAYEFYHQLKKDGVDTKILSKYEDRILPLLTEKPQEILKTVVEPGVTEKRLEEWQDAAKMSEWASEIRPQDNKIAAKAAYFKGRVNYLTDQKDAAIESWKKAADLDKTWALPLNGIGLIFNERKDYESARTWLMQATEREPNWAIPYNNLGSSYFFQNRFSEAAPYYQKAVENAPRWARPHAWLASIAMKNYDCSTAVSEFEKVLAPDALGASEMNMVSIRKQYAKAQNCNYNYDYGN